MMSSGSLLPMLYTFTMSRVLGAVPALPFEPVFRLSVKQYHAMIRAGVLTEDDPVELLEGILIEKMPKNARHSTANGKCQYELPKVLPPGWIVRIQEPITLADSEPEPDVVLARGSLEDYSSRHPGPADVGLVAEVADSSLVRDRSIKLRSYARGGIPTYWIINLEARIIEVYTRPEATIPEPRYADHRVFSAGESLDLVLDGEVVGRLAVAALLP